MPIELLIERLVALKFLSVKRVAPIPFPPESLTKKAAALHKNHSHAFILIEKPCVATSLRFSSHGWMAFEH
jgi:hypothetical protein